MCDSVRQKLGHTNIRSLVRGRLEVEAKNFEQ